MHLLTGFLVPIQRMPMHNRCTLVAPLLWNSASDSVLTEWLLSSTKRLLQCSKCCLIGPVHVHVDYWRLKSRCLVGDRIRFEELGVSTASEEVFETGNECLKQHRPRPMLHFWHTVLWTEQVILLLIRSFRKANFVLHCQSLAEVILQYRTSLPTTMSTSHGGLQSTRNIVILRRSIFRLLKSSRMENLLYTNQADCFQQWLLTTLTSRRVLSS